MKNQTVPYLLKNKIRIVTATSLFDGHDVAINIMRRIMQQSGAEVIHLGHNRSVREIVQTAIHEDVQAVAVTSYQGGHIEFFKYMYDLLKQEGSDHIRIFGGGGGTILPDEINELHNYGITRIYTPDDGRNMGLQGMINDLLSSSDFNIIHSNNGTPSKNQQQNDFKPISRSITMIESGAEIPAGENLEEAQTLHSVPVIGITGTGGSGKSSLVDELIRRFTLVLPGLRIAILCIDPSKRKSGGALLGDRIRMNSIYQNPNVFMRSMATRQPNMSMSQYIPGALTVLKLASFDVIFLETSGIGQADTSIVDFSDLTLYVMTPEFGAPTQLEKIDMLDFADIIAINKFDKRGAGDALKAVGKQYRRNHQKWHESDESLPVVGTIASQYNDSGVHALFDLLVSKLREKLQIQWKYENSFEKGFIKKPEIIPPNRIRYLSEISESIRQYNMWVEEQSDIARKLYCVEQVMCMLSEDQEPAGLVDKKRSLSQRLETENQAILENWNNKKVSYREHTFPYKVRGKTLEVNTFFTSLSQSRIPRVSLPGYHDWGDILKWCLQENVPGEFPFTAGVFPFKSETEEPTRMFAGEGGPERTNKRFHYLAEGMPAKRLSTAFDSVTLYGEDPHPRPDIYGKIGNSGVSICSLDDAKRLYSGFDLSDPMTSVSMTINGPAAIICAFLMNAAIDQQCEIYIRQQGLQLEVEKKLIKLYDDRGLPRPGYNNEIPNGHDGLGNMLLGLTGDQILESQIYDKIKSTTLKKVRGTVQADILKEDQAQNTCIFSTEFSLRIMGDMQAFFTEKEIRNFYSVSISGYHIAEAGANPITQLAFTMANGFTYIEYYLSRGMNIDDFAPNLSFFFSNGLDPEYAVIGRVARRIWAKALKNLYGANERSQKLKYHIQTSGRSLHAQEIDFNDIRTTIQALYAIYDNCNSLHTNAYDEAITTPTEESVRRAMAIQLIINRELGLTKNENPLQGSFIIEELTDLVEEAVLSDFDRLTDRGGVLGAMETMYQRSRIQEESMYYESQKLSGELSIIGVNTFVSKEGSPIRLPLKISRASKEEKERQIERLGALHQAQKPQSKQALSRLKQVALAGGNLFSTLMDTVKYCSLGQITDALYQVGGQYRRNM